jgi:hypothetical protein
MFQVFQQLNMKGVMMSNLGATGGRLWKGRVLFGFEGETAEFASGNPHDKFRDR